jgi:beta-1,4-mannooligosaccharide/beta-1,4-mannosyl-N-acetylglucosamine phosphorylase
MLENLGRFAMTYTPYSRAGPLVALVMTEDFHTFGLHGAIRSPEDKDAAFFPRQFGGRWALTHRPVPHSGSGQGQHVAVVFADFAQLAR